MIVLITPVLNGARFISAMLTSIAAQTDKGWVHYIMDGGSTDGTQDIIRAAMAGEPRLRLVEGRDQGLYDAVFKGFEQARADGFGDPATICCWLNADDMMLPWAFASLREAFARSGAQWITSWPCFWDAEGRMQLVLPYAWYPRGLIRRGLFQGNALGWMQQESSFFTRGLLDRLPQATVTAIRHSKLAGDFLLWRAFAQSAAPMPLALPLSGFRKHDANASGAIAQYHAEMAQAGVWIAPPLIGRILRLIFAPFALLKAASLTRRQARDFLRR